MPFNDGDLFERFNNRHDSTLTDEEREFLGPLAPGDNFSKVDFDKDQSPFIQVDLDSTLEYTVQREIDSSDNLFLVEFEGDVDWYGTKLIALSITIENKDSLIKRSFNIADFPDYDYYRSTHPDYQNSKYKGVAGWFDISLNGLSEFHFEICKSEDIIRINHGKITVTKLNSLIKNEYPSGNYPYDWECF